MAEQEIEGDLWDQSLGLGGRLSWLTTALNLPHNHWYRPPTGTGVAAGDATPSLAERAEYTAPWQAA
jgi:hypothetical protein